MKKLGTTIIAAAAFLALAAGLNVAMSATAHAGGTKGTGAQAGTSGGIAGTVYFRGQAPRLRPILMDKDPVCADAQSGTVLPEDGRVNSNGTLPNAFVYITKGTGNLPSTAPAEPVTLTQTGCTYQPHVLGIMVGQTLRVVSADPTSHNIHVIPKTGHDWNVTQQPGTPPVLRKFTTPEIMIPIRCNIHPWMEAYIGVVTNPFYGVTGNDGRFEIKNVPPGTYTLSIWTATFGTQEKDVTVRAGETAAADFTFNAQ